MGWRGGGGGKPSTKGLWCLSPLAPAAATVSEAGVRSRCDGHVQRQQEQPSGREAQLATQRNTPSHPPPEVQAVRGLRRCLAHPCHLPPLQPAGLSGHVPPIPGLLYPNGSRARTHELPPMVHQEDRSSVRQHAGQRCLWAQALRQHLNTHWNLKHRGPKRRDASNAAPLTPTPPFLLLVTGAREAREEELGFRQTWGQMLACKQVVTLHSAGLPWLKRTGPSLAQCHLEIWDASVDLGSWPPHTAPSSFLPLLSNTEPGLELSVRGKS